MISANGKASDLHRLLLDVFDKIKLKRKDKYVASSNLSIYYTWKKIKKSYKSNKFKKSASTCHEEFELTDGSCSESDIQKFFEYIIETHETVTDNPWIMTYVNKTENKITFNMKTRYYLELLFFKIRNYLEALKVR